MLSVLLIVLAAVVSRGQDAAAKDWPCWRGPGGLGVATDGKALPTTWSPASPNVRWRTPIEGKGLSSPIVVGPRVFVTTASEVAASRRLLDAIGLAAALGVSVLVLLRGGRQRAERGRLTWRRAGRLERVALGAAVAGGAVFVGGTVAALTNDFERMTAALPLGVALVLGVLSAAVATSWLRVVVQRKARNLRAWAPPALLAAALGSLSLSLPPRYTFFCASLLAFAALGLLVGAVPSARPTDLGHLPRELEGVLVVAALLIVLLGAVGSALFPESFWSESTAQHVWRRSLFLALLGCVAAVGACPRHSRLRRAAILTLVALGVVLLRWMPTSELGQAASLMDRATAVAPVALAGSWFALREFARAERPARRGFGPVAAPLGLLALSVWIFVRANVLQPGVQVEPSLVCLDRDTGAPLWRTALSRTPAEYLDTFRTSHATPTPASDGEVVVAHFGAVTACVDLAGRVLWTHEHPGFVATSIYGAGSSPVIAGDRVLVLQEREREHALRPSFYAAYALATGELLWRVEPREAQSAYGTPLLYPPEAPTEAIHATWNAIVSHDLATGARLWSRELRATETVTSLVADEERLAFAGGSAVGLTAILDLPAQKAGAPEVRWQTRRATPSCSSPVLHEGRLYTVTQAGLLTAFDAASGSIVWQERLAPGDYYASLLVGDGKLYASNADGLSTVLRAGDSFEVLAENELGQGLHASPAAADGRLYLRGLDSVVCIE